VLELFSQKRNGVVVEIKDFLAPAQVVIDVRATNKTRLLRDLARRAAGVLQLSEDTIAQALLKREALGSTGTGAGIAIPHARLEAVSKPFGMLVRLAKAMDFDAIDGRPVDVVFLLLLPAEPRGEQLNALACVARQLRDAQTIRDVRHAADDAALYHAVAPNSGPRKP